MLKQTNMFGGVDRTRPLPCHLPKPLNDWALAIFILLNHPKGVTVFDAMSKYGMVKFQERLNEVLSEYPSLASKKMIKVPKRLGRIVDVMRYRIEESDAATDLYMEKLNHKGGSKCLRPVKTIPNE
jgi:hypothetical protein